MRFLLSKSISLLHSLLAITSRPWPWAYILSSGPTTKLLKNTIPMHRFANCQRQLYGQLTHHMICGGKKDEAGFGKWYCIIWLLDLIVKEVKKKFEPWCKDTCKGDSGGPLVAHVDYPRNRIKSPFSLYHNNGYMDFLIRRHFRLHGIFHLGNFRDRDPEKFHPKSAL